MISRRAFLLAPVTLAFGQAAELKQGYRLLYHLQFSEARAIFLTWQREHPTDPMGLASEAASYLFEEFELHGVLTVEFFLNDETLLGGIRGKADAARTRSFAAANQRAKELAESQLRRTPGDATALLALTLASGMQADYLSLIEKSQIASLRQIRSAGSFGERLLKVAPSIADAYMALGAANYILACLPSYKRAVLWFGGMQGDKQRGMDQLAKAANTGVYLGPYAKIMLALALVREKRANEAKRLMKELAADFPQSPLFAREQAKIERL